ncbi:MAG: hypothetical protein AB1454_10515 [Candidatus Auribacterota bacterium]
MSCKIFLFYITLFLVLSISNHPCFCAQVFAPSYPLSVQAKEHAEAHELVYFCTTYITYLRNQWGLTAKKVSPVSVIAVSSGNDSMQRMQNGSVVITVNTNNHDFKTTLSHALTGTVIQDCIAEQYQEYISIPLTITYGIEGIFSHIKILPRYVVIHRKLSDFQYIPPELLFSIQHSLSEETEDIFRLESVYMMEFFGSYGIRGQQLIGFIAQYAKNSSTAILEIANKTQCYTPDRFEALFLESTIQKKVVYNLASASERLKETDILDLIHDILLFDLYDPSHPTGHKLSRFAFDLTIADFPCVEAAQIDKKILMLRSLKESGILQEGIEHLITALEYLRKNDYESYYDHLYLAQRTL